MAELDRRGTGYSDEHIKIKSLCFADDVLIFNLKDQPEYLGNIKVVPKLKYL